MCTILYIFMFINKKMCMLVCEERWIDRVGGGAQGTELRGVPSATHLRFAPRICELGACPRVGVALLLANYPPSHYLFCLDSDNKKIQVIHPDLRYYLPDFLASTAIDYTIYDKSDYCADSEDSRDDWPAAHAAYCLDNPACDCDYHHDYNCYYCE